jgi:hypothetical protein
MWRHYYERRYLSLFVDLYDNSPTQYRFSPWDSVRISQKSRHQNDGAKPRPTRSLTDAHTFFPSIKFARVSSTAFVAALRWVRKQSLNQT